MMDLKNKSLDQEQIRLALRVSELEGTKLDLETKINYLNDERTVILKNNE